MQRRNFCKLLAIAAASKALLSPGQTTQEDIAAGPSGFNHYTRSYAVFCELPPEKRVYYKASGNRIVETRLDEATWQPPAWNYNPTPSSIAGGLWDDVPTHAPIPDLAGDGPYQPT